MPRKKTHISELDLSTIGGRIAYLRVKNNLTQSQLAEKTGLSKGHISGLESHKYEPSSRAITKIVELFEVTADWLLFGDKIISRKKTSLETLLDRFKNSDKIIERNEDLLVLEAIDKEGFEEIHKIIKIKLDTKQSSIEKQKEKRKKSAV